MRSFARALSLALRHRWTVAGCLLSSIVVAAFWAVNLTAAWPIVDVVMRDKSMAEWFEGKRVEAVQRVERLREEQSSLLAMESLTAEQRQRAGDVEFRLAVARGWRDQMESLSALLADRLPKTPFTTLVWVCFALLAGTVVKNVFRVANLLLVARLGGVVGHELRDEFYGHALRLDPEEFTERGRGDLINRCTGDLDSVSKGVETLFGQAVREPLKMIACGVGAALVSWRLLLLTAVVAPVAYFTIRYLAKSLKRANKRAMELMSGIFENLSESLAGIRLIKACTREPSERARFGRASEKYYHRQLKIGFYNSLISPVTENLGVAMVVLAAMAGGYLVLNQQTTLFGIPITDRVLTHGLISVFFAMLAGMSDPARRMSGLFNTIQKASAASERVYEVLDRQPQVADPARPIPLETPGGTLRLEHVTFKYRRGDTALADVNLAVAEGERVAIVGPNGCGKSTLLGLIPRFFDPTEGRVRLGSVDLRDCRLDDLRSRLAVVSQQALLLNDTVAANIGYGRPDATKQQIEAAARAAHAHTFISEQLEEGYDTLVGPQGSRLSGGQRQRIALARAILREPEVLILDEATSQIDLESEQLIHQVLREFTQGRTTLMVTHRLSSLDLVDRVVVMDGGRIVDSGAIAELKQRCDLFKRLYSGVMRAA